MGYSLKPFQFEDAKRIYSMNGRTLLASEMGTGKTIIALYWILKTPKRRPVVIVCPAGLRWTWQAEAALHFNMRVEVLEGRAPARLNGLPGEVVVVGYDILASWLPHLRRHRPQTVVYDECQYVKNHRAQRSKAAWQLAKKATSVLGLSGTPMVNRPIELWSVLRLIRPDLFPDRNAYAWRYCSPKWTPWGWQFNGAEHTEELHGILKRQCMIRRLKKDVLKDLPEKQRRVIAFKLDSYKEYNHAQNDFLHWLRTISPSKAVRAARSQALVKVGYLLRLVAQAKLKQTKLWLQGFFECHPNEKLMALTMHTAIIDELHAAFPQSLIVDGRVTGRRRADTVHLFQTNRHRKLLLGNWRAAGLGITLTAACYGVALDMPWTPGDLLQGEDRLHRIGQKQNVMVFYLTALETIEEKLMKILLKKSKVLDAVLNGNASAMNVDLFEELLKDFVRM